MHDVAALRVTPLDPVAGADDWRPWRDEPMYAPQDEDWGLQAASEADVRPALKRAAPEAGPAGGADGGRSGGQCCGADEAERRITVS